MTTSPTRKKKPTPRQRVIYSLPPDLVDDIGRFAGAFHDGNKSGSVAAAIRAYIDRLRKVRYTAKMRQSYAASAAASRKIGAIWDAASEEAWRGIDAKERVGNN